MLAHIVAGHVRQAGRQMAVGGRVRHGAQRIGWVQASGDRPPAPGAAEVQAIQMGDLAVGAVADGGWREQAGGQALGTAVSE